MRWQIISHMGKCSSPIVPNLFNSLISNNFQSMVTSVFSLKLCQKKSRWQKLEFAHFTYIILIIAVFDIISVEHIQ